MSLPNVPFAIQRKFRVALGNTVSWYVRNISNAIQKLGDAEEADSAVQILNEVLDQCENRFTTVPTQGEDAIRMIVDFVDECDRGHNQT